MIRVALASTTDAVTLAIEDEGPGIEPALRERVFESYFRVPGNAEEGTGLGLAIVKEIAVQHGASVDIDYASGGRGTRITVRFSPVGASSRALHERGRREPATASRS
jgi:signal transduction histidine kinase